MRNRRSNGLLGLALGMAAVMDTATTSSVVESSTQTEKSFGAMVVPSYTGYSPSPKPSKKRSRTTRKRPSLKMIKSKRRMVKASRRQNRK